MRLPLKQHEHALIGCLRLTKGRGRAPWRKARRGLGRPPKDLRQAAHPLVLDCALYERECNRPHVRSNAFTSPASPHPHGIMRHQTSVMRSPTALAVRPIPWHMSIHDRDYLWTAHGHSCLVIMAAVAPKSLLREVRSSPHCGSVRDQTSVMRSPTALAVRPIP